MVGFEEVWIAHGERIIARVGAWLDGPTLARQVVVPVRTSRSLVGDLERGIVLDVEMRSGHVDEKCLVVQAMVWTSSIVKR